MKVLGIDIGGTKTRAVVLDPQDECTFWMTGEYFAATSSKSMKSSRSSRRTRSSKPVASAATPVTSAAI